ncbi:MAG: transglutaminase domain protein [Deltaproteobacteria bacterium]|nr:transglutaminase domain protein [Deltaproteobacteria bacterium]
MRFAVAHKATTYMMVGCAYLALVAGGTLPSVLSLGSLIGLIVSWWWEPPRIRFEKWSWVWTILSILALIYSLLTALVTFDFLLVGAEFLVWLTVVKAFNRKAARDWQQMYLLAFLMLVAGSVLNPDLTYGLCFFGFVIASTWALTLFHLRREMEDNLLVKHAADRASERVEVRRILDSRRIVGGRFFVGTGFLSFGVFVGAAVVFLSLPRVGIGFFLKSRGGLTLSGFSDGVNLGGHGVIKTDSTVVMRVEVNAQFGAREAPQIHWRGVAFDKYHARQWSRSTDAPRTNQTLEQSQTTDRRVLLWAGRALPIPEIERLKTSTVKQEIWLEPLDSDVLFGASNPRIVEYTHTLRRHNPIERNDEMRLEHGTTVHYTVFSEINPPSADVLRASEGPLPTGFEVYLQLPEEITPRTRKLAQTITAHALTRYDKAMAIKTWLGKNLTYTLELEEPMGEAVDFFLFERKKGHCEYFASAFAVLARAAGIPVRTVNGFLGGEWNEYQNYVAVRAGDAHSWNEVYFAQPGPQGGADAGTWVTFDATPPADIDLLGRGGTGWRARMSRFMDTLRFQWSKWVIEYDLISQLSLVKSLGDALQTAGHAVKVAAIWVKDVAVEYWQVSIALAGTLMVCLGLRRRRRRTRAPVASRAERRKRSSVAQVYDAVAKQLAKAGNPRGPSVTPREHAERMTTRGDPAAREVSELVELYYATEWGHRAGTGPDVATEDRAAALARTIRSTLIAARSQPKPPRSS